MEQNWRGEAGRIAGVLEDQASYLRQEEEARRLEDENLRRCYYELINVERTARLELAQGQRQYVDDQDRKLAQSIGSLWYLGFWNRMRWIVGLRRKL